MTLPVGIGTCIVTFGDALDVLGEKATIKATVTPDRTLIWAATGDAIYPTSAPLTSGAEADLSFALPHVDQAGFIDTDGDSVTNWSYRVKAWITFSDSTQQIISKDLQVFVGQSTVDLDLVPTGVATVPEVVAPYASVMSVAGFTGVVSADDLRDELGGGDVTYALLPAGVPVVVYYDAEAGWPDSPTDRDDIPVMWIDLTGEGGQPLARRARDIVLAQVLGG